MIPPHAAQAMFAAIEKSDTATLDGLLSEHGGDPDLALLRNAQDISLLSWAVRTADVATVDLLAGAGLPMDAACGRGAKPLHNAVARGDPEIVQCLLEHGAHPDQTSLNGLRALDHTTTRDDARIAALLLAHGAHPDASPLGSGGHVLRAVDVGAHQVLGELVAAGAALDERGIQEPFATPAGHAVDRHNTTATAMLLAAGVDPDQGNDPRGPLMLGAAMHGDVPMVDLLASHGADLSTREAAGLEGSVFQAVAKDHVDAVQALAAAGADLDHQSQRGWTALHQAVHMGHLGATHALLAAGANPNLRTEHGETPAHFAVNSSLSDPTMALLVEAGADLSLPDHAGRDPVQGAVHAMNLGALNVAGAGAPEAVDASSLLALRAAATAAARQHQRAVAPAGTAAPPADDRAPRAVLDMLGQHGVDPLERTRAGATAVHAAHFHGLRDVLDTLADQGAVPAPPDALGIEAATYGRADSGIPIPLPVATAVQAAVWGTQADALHTQAQAATSPLHRHVLTARAQEQALRAERLQQQAWRLAGGVDPLAPDHRLDIGYRAQATSWMAGAIATGAPGLPAAAEAAGGAGGAGGAAAAAAVAPAAVPTWLQIVRRTQAAEAGPPQPAAPRPHEPR
ncbi:ankyrin repeat domain-containing protein [Hydrogenophaga sp.]|uniref:ankyrin repeat domain-containing protein n=1 Tax=Hydrogenophaga sp. TaxID=1904254 RepID=UPI00260A856F|nr:ankyrin repeat domain-containing protein [Hydrogenophaga sp.]MCW5654903.1 ankyrin repeat domain-containing protein [Hydrogenophaga sp.]